MSRSCHSATFSSEARAFVRTRRARPATCSQPTGFLLWGMAEEPFWPEPKGSSTSRTSVFWRARISVANFSRLAAIEGEGGHHLGVPVALEDLRRDGRGQHPEPCADRLLDLRGQVREGAHRARQLAERDVGPRPVEPRELPLQLRVPQRHLQAEGHGLGVDAVGAADHRRVLVAQGPLLHRLHEVEEVGADEVAGVAHQDGEGGVHHVRGGEPVVQPAPLGPHALRHAGDEGDHVVLDLLLDLLDARDVEAGLLLDRGEGLLRHDAAPDEDLGGGDLHLQPGREAVLVGPQASHLGTRVARDHGLSFPRTTGRLPWGH